MSLFKTEHVIHNYISLIVMTEPERYGTTKQNVGKVYYLLEKVEGDILDDSIFKSCINQAFDDVVSYSQLIQSETGETQEKVENIELNFIECQWGTGEKYARDCEKILGGEK